MLATVGETSTCSGSEGEMIVGVPDGLGAYLVDDKTVRAICQSEVRKSIYCCVIFIFSL